jgi:hypothetical protein
MSGKAAQGASDAPGPVQGAVTEVWPTADGPAPQLAVQPHRHCPVCGRWYALDTYGRIAVHDSSNGECPGSRESTDLTAKMSKVVEQGIAPTPEVLDAAHAIVRALTPGGGRTNRVESEDELKHRLAEDGVKINRKQSTLLNPKPPRPVVLEDLRPY